MGRCRATPPERDAGDERQRRGDGADQLSRALRARHRCDERTGGRQRQDRDQQPAAISQTTHDHSGDGDQQRAAEDGRGRARQRRPGASIAAQPPIRIVPVAVPSTAPSTRAESPRLTSEASA